MSYPVSIKGVLLIGGEVVVLFEVIPSKHVFIVTYGCRLRRQFEPALSTEHTAFGVHALDALDALPLPPGYKRSIQSWSKHAGS